MGSSLVPTLVTFLLLAVLYATTATWSSPYRVTNDAFTNAMTGWSLADDGTVVVASLAPLAHEAWYGDIGWFLIGERGPVSKFPPGAGMAVAPFYLVSNAAERPVVLPGKLDDELEPVEVAIPPLWPATLSSVMLTAMFGGALAATAVRLGLGRARAIVVALGAGVATSAWSVASDQSWGHGPAMLCIGLSGLAAARDRWLACGVALGLGILVRPHIAVIAAVVGLGVSAARRQWRPAVLIGLGSGTGLATLLAFNARHFGSASVTGGYRDDFVSRALSGDVLAFLTNTAAGLVHPEYGLLVWAPFLLILGLAAWRTRSGLPDWTVWLALGGIAYLLLQWKANRASGGINFFPYRYPLEALAAAAPLLVLAAVRWWDGGRRIDRALLTAAVGFAFIGQLLGAVGWKVM